MIEPTDISLVLSGGSLNTDPNESIGGDPSSTAVPDGINNLFDDVSQDDTEAGRTDYRCFYVFNDHPTDTFKSVVIWLDSEVADGASVTLGITAHNDLQVLAVTGAVSGGTLTISLDGNQATFFYHNDLQQWGQNFEDALNGLPGVSGAHVSASLFAGTATFQVAFQGADANRYFPVMTIVSNDLTGSGTITVSVTKLVDGAPINSVAPQIDQATSTPTGVTFADSTFETPITIGNLRATEGFPIWIRRVTPEGATPLSEDGFTLGINGDPIQ